MLQKIQAELKALNPQTRIVAVSKLQSVEKIQTLYNQGQKVFAENYAQEALQKQQTLADLPIEWHFIGRIQKNKLKAIVGNFSLLHSVDSLGLALAINQKAAEKGLQQQVLLQLNLAGEASKGGFSEKLFAEALPELKKLEHLRCCGLMTMPPLFTEAEKARPYFQNLRKIRDKTLTEFPDCRELSMGTSADYQIAAMEGATLVRLGTLLFGERPQLHK